MLLTAALTLMLIASASVSGAKSEDESASIWVASESDIEFWEGAQIEGDEVEGYQSLEQMVDSSTAVIIGRVDSIGEGRVVGDPATPEDQVEYPALNVQVVQLLAGELPVVEGKHILVETLGSGVRGRQPPKGAVVMFLRYKGELYERHPELDGSAVAEGDKQAYRWVSSDGLYMESRGKAFNPLIERATPDGDSDEIFHAAPNAIAEDVEQRGIGDLVSRIKQLAGR